MVLTHRVALGVGLKAQAFPSGGGGSRNAEFRGSFYISNDVFMFALLLLFRCFLEVGRGTFRSFSLSFSSPGAGFSPFWVGASV
jgi:hypothetical protein